MSSKTYKKSVYIVYSNFMDDYGEKFQIGGIQQYIFGLIEVFNKDFNIKVIQKANSHFDRKFGDFEVKGFSCSSRNLGANLFERIKNEINPEDYLIWGSDRIAAKIKHQNTVSIQHGITFDFLDYKNITFGNILEKSLIFSVFYRLLQQYSAGKYFLRAPKVVCVDNNFLNWIRTVLPRNLTDRAVVIPNFSKLPLTTQIKVIDSGNIKILFARRFVEYRGVYILCDIVEYFLKKYTNVEFGIYGGGPLEAYLKEKFDGEKRVHISSYTADMAQEIQLQYDISLIPTYGSEGTSLSLLESMACGCVPVATNVGGMTNIVIDGYNGFLVNPDKDDFIKRIEYLICNPEIMSRVRKNARQTIEEGFSFEKWAEKWNNIID